MEEYSGFRRLKYALRDRALLTIFDELNLIETFDSVEDAFAEIYSQYIVDDTLKFNDQMIDFRFQLRDNYISPGYNDETGEDVQLKLGKRDDGSTYLVEL